MTYMLKKATIKVLSEVLPGNEPGFLIAGAQKSATTSLHYYLNQHPDLRGQKIESGCGKQEPGLFRRGIYLPQIQRDPGLFGKDQVLILGFKELASNLVYSLNRILNFLGLPESDWAFLNCNKRNVNRYLVKLQPETEQFLKDFYQPYNEALFKYLGYHLDW